MKDESKKLAESRMQKAVIIICRVKGVKEVRLTLTPLTLNKI